MSTLRYPFTASPYDTYWRIDFPDIPGLTSAAETWEDIGPQARDALESWLDAANDEGIPIPEPSQIHATAAPLDLLTVEQMAERLGVVRSRVYAIASDRGIGERIANVLVFREADVERMRPRRRGRPRKNEDSPNQ